jgi:hypothetical protein
MMHQAWRRSALFVEVKQCSFDPALRFPSAKPTSTPAGVKPFISLSQIVGEHCQSLSKQPWASCRPNEKSRIGPSPVCRSAVGRLWSTSLWDPSVVMSRLEAGGPEKTKKPRSRPACPQLVTVPITAAAKRAALLEGRRPGPRALSCGTANQETARASAQSASNRRCGSVRAVGEARVGRGVFEIALGAAGARGRPSGSPSP